MVVVVGRMVTISALDVDIIPPKDEVPAIILARKVLLQPGQYANLQITGQGPVK
jgi:hypothetical protein